MAAIAAALALPRSAEAALIKGDFLTAGDGYLITDTLTPLAWLTPYYTRNHTWNDAFVQGINTTYGFRYATAAETLSMLTNNFGSVTTAFPGDAAGFAAAQSFFNLFGINWSINCTDQSTTVPCPRTQGLTADVGSPGTHLGFGMIQRGSSGWMIVNNNWSDSFDGSQMGSFLVRQQAAPVPEPTTLLLVGAGLTLVAAARRRNR